MSRAKASRSKIQSFLPRKYIISSSVNILTLRYCPSRCRRCCSRVPSLFDRAIARLCAMEVEIYTKRLRKAFLKRDANNSCSTIGRESFPQGNRSGRASAGSEQQISNNRIGGTDGLTGLII